MKINKKRIDKVSIELANSIALNRIAHAKKLVKDPDKESRLQKQLCVPCQYSPRIGGASITYIECAICSKDMVFGSTAVDILCHDCASKNNLCKCCGADIDLKNRRKPRNYEENQ